MVSASIIPGWMLLPLFPMLPCILENKSSSLCASGWLPESYPHSIALWTWITFEAPHKPFLEDMAFQSFHLSQDLQSISDPSYHPSTGCYLQLLSFVLQHKDLPAQHWSHLQSSMWQGRTSSARSVLSPKQSAFSHFSQQVLLPILLHSEILRNYYEMNMRTYWVLFLWGQSLSDNGFHYPHHILK